MKCPTVWFLYLKNYNFHENKETIKFSKGMHYRSVISIEKLQFSQKTTKTLKLTVLIQTDNFSKQTNYRSPYFIEKIHILSDFFVPTNHQNLMKSWKLSDFLEKYIILKHFTRAFQ